ncbi:hypothetical protein M407DRAFT_83509 [Tulasnella calospora MUT 4182]|uniref:Protein kinase domain-containing protein n=1 Tax=Tulasnella calospora MUT 4182 TaxID=1051891 RepID=A0A0C3Q5J0_9AGAM|nr:hypothetical protein M407DRAFT_83509 [Tulasnella calospora MUT 4182]
MLRFRKALKFNQLAIREVELLAELDHPNIVELEGFVEDAPKSMIWLVFHWAYHGDLKEFVGSVDWEIPERIFLIHDVAQGLAYLHSREPPICHGDLKSLNVLVDWRCCARITDFGSAHPFCASTTTITLTGNKYTLRWAAPELLLEDQLSLWSDIWALGWIAYEVMTESLPFEDVTSDIVVVERVLGGKLPSLIDNAHLSLIHELCSLMNMCWKSNPTERPTAISCRESMKQMVRERGSVRIETQLTFC